MPYPYTRADFEKMYKVQLAWKLITRVIRTDDRDFGYGGPVEDVKSPHIIVASPFLLLYFSVGNKEKLINKCCAAEDELTLARKDVPRVTRVTLHALEYAQLHDIQKASKYIGSVASYHDAEAARTSLALAQTFGIVPMQEEIKAQMQLRIEARNKQRSENKMR